MRNIQFVLLTMFLVGTVLYFTRTRSRLIDRVFVLAFALAGVVLVSFPETSDWLASVLGVGRGADAVIYFMLVFLSYACLQLYAKIRSQDAQLVELARSIAIQNAKLPGQFDESLPDVLRMPEVRTHRDSEWTSAPSIDAQPEFQPFRKAG
jgi:small membrane protein